MFLMFLDLMNGAGMFNDTSYDLSDWIYVEEASYSSIGMATGEE